MLCFAKQGSLARPLLSLLARAGSSTRAALAARSQQGAELCETQDLLRRLSTPAPLPAYSSPGAWDDDDDDEEGENADGTTSYSSWEEDEYVVHDDAVPDSFQFDALKRVKLKVTPEKLERAAARARRDFVCAEPRRRRPRRAESTSSDEHTLSELCIELVKLQEHVKARGLKVRLASRVPPATV